MEYLKDIIEIFLHLDKHLDVVIRGYGLWTYAVLFLIVFCETGLVVTPILPGDSLLFAAGTFSAVGSLDPVVLAFSLSIAAISGDTLNYWIGRFTGPKVFHYEDSRFFKKEYLERTRRFYEKYGGKTIVLARFVPIVRTFAPFVAGVGRMSYKRFIVYNISGGIFWIVFFISGGYFFGNIPVVRKNFSMAIMVIIFISILPGIMEFIKHRTQSKRQG